MTIRSLIVKSWAASQRRERLVGELPPNAASFAGRLLEAAEGDARAARDAVPTGADEDFERRVRTVLSAVVDEESVELSSRMKTGS